MHPHLLCFPLTPASRNSSQFNQLVGGAVDTLPILANQAYIRMLVPRTSGFASHYRQPIALANP
jgi:hypothetical protein